MTDELDDMLNVYKNVDDPIRGSTGIAERRSELCSGREICGNLYLTADINKGTFSATNGTWTQQKIYNYYCVMKEVKQLTV